MNVQCKIPALFHLKNWVGDVSVHCLNLANTEYQSMPGRPMPLRTIQLTLIMKFKNQSK
jgi:hypothetical protein